MVAEPVAWRSRGAGWWMPALKQTIRAGIHRCCRMVFNHEWVYRPDGKQRICTKCKRLEDEVKS